MPKASEGVPVDVGLFDEEPPLSTTTLAGAMQRISASSKKRAARGLSRQCSSTFVSGKRRATITFCTLEAGHEGEHRGFRKRWPQADKPTPIE